MNLSWVYLSSRYFYAKDRLILYQREIIYLAGEVLGESYRGENTAQGQNLKARVNF